jgi:ferredoxin
MPKKLHIDSKSCIGCTLCTQIAPNTFEMQDDGKSHVVKNPKDPPDKISQAVESCPVNAVKYE